MQDLTIGEKSAIVFVKEKGGKMKLFERIRGAVQGWREGFQGLYKDSLTKTLNRNFLEDGYLEHLAAEAVRYEHNLTIVMIDIDNFKLINDRYGHLSGDRALILLAKVLKENLRKTDWIVRYGGDEFTLFLPKTNKQATTSLMKRLEARMKTICVNFEISYGIADITDIEREQVSIAKLIDRADIKLINNKASKSG
jgi:diguanylate cyclase (GGDEF)-like protein